MENPVESHPHGSDDPSGPDVVVVQVKTSEPDDRFRYRECEDLRGPRFLIYCEFCKMNTINTFDFMYFFFGFMIFGFSFGGVSMYCIHHISELASIGRRLSVVCVQVLLFLFYWIITLSHLSFHCSKCDRLVCCVGEKVKKKVGNTRELIEKKYFHQNEPFYCYYCNENVKLYMYHGKKVKTVFIILCIVVILDIFLLQYEVYLAWRTVPLITPTLIPALLSAGRCSKCSHSLGMNGTMSKVEVDESGLAVVAHLSKLTQRTAYRSLEPYTGRPSESMN